MVEDFLDIWIITSFPLGVPNKVKFLHIGDELLVDELKVKKVSSIFWDVLSMAAHMMDQFGSVLEIIEEGVKVHDGVDRFLLVLGHSMDPHIDEVIHLAKRIFPQPNLLGLFLLPIYLSPLVTKIIIVFYFGALDGFPIMINT